MDVEIHTHMFDVQSLRMDTSFRDSEYLCLDIPVNAVYGQAASTTVLLDRHITYPTCLDRDVGNHVGRPLLACHQKYEGVLS